MSEMSREPRRRWGTRREALSLAPPTDIPYIDYPHATQRGFYCRVLKADRDGNVRRSWVHRYKVSEDDGLGGQKVRERKHVLGLVDAVEPADILMPLEDALEVVLGKRRAHREAKQDGTGSIDRLTVGQAWSFYDTEKRLNRETTKAKDKGHYDRYLAHLKDRFLDELPYAFWSRFVAQLGSGSLVVGTRQDDTGRMVSISAPKLANSSMLAILNVASALYGIAHKHTGLRGMSKNDNPAREAKALVGEPNKRRGRIPLKKLAMAWAATDQMCQAGWRDMLRLYVLTGLRNALMTTMQFSEIDFASGCYVVSPHKPGTKRRGKKTPVDAPPIRLPLSKKALDILATRRFFAPDKNGDVWYSQPPIGKDAGEVPRMGDARKAWKPVEVLLDLHFTPHDLRRTFAGLGAAAADDLFAVSLLMMHSSNTLAKAAGIPEITLDYIDTDEAQDRMRKAAESIAAHVDALITLGITATHATPEPSLPPELMAALAATD